MQINDNTITKFLIYDAGTRTGPGSSIQGYSKYEFFSAVFITYDKTDKESFDNIKKFWMKLTLIILIFLKE